MGGRKMIDQRHYLITLMVVFLSLSIGIFIGNALLGNDLVISQQREVIERLQRNYCQLQGERDRLEEQLRGLEIWEETGGDLERVFLPLLKNEGDIGTQVAIVNSSGEDLDYGLLEYLQEYGINVCCLGEISPSLGPHNEKLMAALEKEYSAPAAEMKGDWLQFVGYLANAMIGGEGKGILPFLIDQGLVTIRGGAEAGIDVVLLLGSSVQGRPAETVELEGRFLDIWREAGLRVVAAEKMDPQASPGFYRAMGVPTISHLNTLAGRLSLLYLLDNDVEEHFGHGEGQIPLLPLEWLLDQVPAG